MATREFDPVQDLHAWVSKEVALTEWTTVEQEHINRFADATGDHQWIHVGVERSRKESSSRTTVAPGFLTLSPLSRLHGEAITFRQS